jgi:hypothetical protein
MNREELQSLVEQVRQLSLLLPMQDADFQSVVDSSIGKRNAVKRVQVAWDEIAESRDALNERLQGAIKAGAVAELRMLETRNLAQALKGGFDAPNPLEHKFGAVVELAELADKLRVAKPCQAFKIHCRTFKGTHRDKALAWLKLHPHDTRTVEQVKRAAERIKPD